MKKFFLLAFFAMIASSVLYSKSKVVTDSLYSRILGCYRPYNICLPDGYQKNKDKMYPVLYLLHGYGGNNKSWQKRAYVDEVLDYLVAEGKSCQMIIVMPDADADLEKAQHGYFNHQEWRYEDFFFQEFLPSVEKKYRIVAEKGSRAIAGLSMGGGGSVAYAQKHPELFCAVYAMSAFVRVSSSKPITDDMESKVNLMRISARENDCVTFVEKASEKVRADLRSVSWYIDCGDDDHLLEVNLELAAQMREARIPFELRVREGGHKWEYWRSALHICLPYMTRQFGR